MFFGSFWYADIKNKYLKIKKYYFNIFFNKKYFKNKLLPQYYLKLNKE